MTDVAELMLRDPLKYTKEDLTDIVNDLRSRRHQFNLGAKTTKPPTVKEVTTKAVSDIDTTGFSL